VRRRHVCALVLAVSCGCATSAGFREGRTALSSGEKGLEANLPERKGEGFRKSWKRPGQSAAGRIKWSEAAASAVPEAPPELLQVIRDEVGRLNQAPISGPAVFLTVTIYRFERRWWGPREVSIELVIRDEHGQLLWLADDTLRPSEQPEGGLAETESDLLARALVRKLSKALGR
jgi:hypothetical protein